MYDELIAELRQHHCDAKEDDTQEVCEECSYDVIIVDKSAPSGIASVCVCGLMNRAADAIEELSDKLAIAEEDKIKLFCQIPRWISVTERLPNAGRYLALTTPCINSGKPFARILRFSENLESVDRYDFDGISRSGWYYYDDEYGHIEVETVTHWMPLPEPPKEGET